jgi:hypothetical protein
LKALLLLLLFFYLSGIHKAQPLIGAPLLVYMLSLSYAPLEEAEQEELFKTLALIQCAPRGNKTPYFHSLFAACLMHECMPRVRVVVHVRACMPTKYTTKNSQVCARHFLVAHTPRLLIIYFSAMHFIGT